MVKKLRAAFIALLLAIVSVGVFVACGGGKDLKDAEITFAESEYVYTGSEIKPEITVTLGGSKIKNSDLAIKYTDNINAGTATVTIAPMPNSGYTGSKSENFTISPAETPAQNQKGKDAIEVTYRAGQTIGDALAGKYSDIQSDNGYTADTVLDLIGENVYEFTALYLDVNPNYRPYTRTVTITVKKADPTSVGNLGTETYEAALGDEYSVIQAHLPLGVEIKDGYKDLIFTQAGIVEVPVIAKQVVNAATGEVDDYHYNTVDSGLAARVDVAKGLFTLENDGEIHTFEYDSVAFTDGGDGTFTVDGAVNLYGLEDAYKDWEFDITLSRDGLTQFIFDTEFKNVANSSLNAVNKDAKFNFADEWASSYMGTNRPDDRYIYSGTNANKTGKEPTGQNGTKDYVWLPDLADLGDNVRIIVKSWINPATQTTREYRIYIGAENATIDSGMIQLFSRNTSRTHQVRFEMQFETTKPVTVKHLSVTESAYINNKLWSLSTAANDQEAKFSKYFDNYKTDNPTIKSAYAGKSLLMIGDSLVDYWAVDGMAGGSKAATAATEKMFADFGYKKPVINLAIGGATAEGWVNWLESGENYFEQIDPEAVFILIGCNQIGNEDEKNISEFIIMVAERVRELYPDTEIIVNSLMPTTQTHSRYANWSRLANANPIVKNWIESGTDDHIHFLDVHNLFSPDPTKPVSTNNTNAPLQSSGYYHTDGLHFMKKAYEAWTPKLLDLLAEIGLVERTQITLAVENEKDLSGQVTWSYTAYNGHIVMDLAIDLQGANGEMYELVSLKLGDRDVTANYNKELGTLTVDWEGATPATLTFTVKLHTLVHTDVKIALKSEGGSPIADSVIEEMTYVAYDGHIEMSLAFDSHFKPLEMTVVVDGQAKSVLAYYDIEKGRFVIDLEEIGFTETPSEITITITLKEVEDPNDNTKDDSDFT